MLGSEPHPDDGAFAAAVGAAGAVTIAGHSTRGGPVPGVRLVRAPTGVRHVDASEMTVRCAAGTPVVELLAALAPHRQTVTLPPSGTVGGALAAGHSTILLVSPQVRAAVKQMTESSLPQLVVMSFNEVTRDTTLVTHGVVNDN